MTAKAKRALELLKTNFVESTGHLDVSDMQELLTEFQTYIEDYQVEVTSELTE